MCSSASRWAARAPWAESSSATVRAVAGERPLASYSAVAGQFSLRGVGEFACFLRDLRAFAVALAGDRNVLT